MTRRPLHGGGFCRLRGRVDPQHEAPSSVIWSPAIPSDRIVALRIFETRDEALAGLSE